MSSFNSRSQYSPGNSTERKRAISVLASNSNLLRRTSPRTPWALTPNSNLLRGTSPWRPWALTLGRPKKRQVPIRQSQTRVRPLAQRGRDCLENLGRTMSQRKTKRWNSRSCGCGRPQATGRIIGYMTTKRIRTEKDYDIVFHAI